MPDNIYRGDAPARRQVLLVGPPAPDQLTGRFAFTVNGKTLVAEGWSAASIVAAWQALILPEFREITPSVASGGDYAAGAILLTGPADGTPFDVVVESTAVVKIETLTAGESPVNEVQTVSLQPATAGTFTLTFDGQTTLGIAYNASATAVQTALEALSNIAPGDVAVTGFAGGPWAVEFRGTYAAIEVTEMTLDTTGLTLDTSGFVTVSTVADGAAGTDLILILAHDTNRDEYLWYKGQNLFFNLGQLTLPTAAQIEAFLEAADGRNWAVVAETGNSWRATLSATQLVAGLIPADTDFDWSTSSTDPNVGNPPQGSQVFYAQFGEPAADETQQVSVLDSVSGGTFTLTLNAQTTAAIAYNASATAVKTAVEALGSVTAVTVTGIDGGPWNITFTDPGEQNLNEMTADGSLLTSASGGTVTETTEHDPGTQEQQRITIPDSVIGGTFVLIYQSDRTAAIAYDATAATIDSAIEASIESIGVGGVSVDGPAGGPWLVTFTPKADSTLLEADATGLTTGESDLIDVQQAPGGPTHWSDPQNWTLARPPESGDTVWLDQPGLNILHSLRQRTGFSLGDASLDTLRADGSMHFTADQKVTLRTTGTLPGGLTVGDYYVVDPDMANLTFKLSATRGGSVVDLTTATGTGTQTAVVELDELHPTARFSGRLGLPRRNALDYWEYRPGYLSVGFRAAGPKVLRIGAGDGPGSGRMKIDAGADAVIVRVIQTGGSAEGSVPACLCLLSNNTIDFVQLDGDTGLSFFPGESSTIRSLDVRGGSLSGGESLTIEGAVTAVVGSVRGRYLDASGNSHRWE